jgi:hypothetical protein
MHKPVNGEQKGGYSLVHVVFFSILFIFFVSEKKSNKHRQVVVVRSLPFTYIMYLAEKQQIIFFLQIFDLTLS